MKKLIPLLVMLLAVGAVHAQSTVKPTTPPAHHTAIAHKNDTSAAAAQPIKKYHKRKHKKGVAAHTAAGKKNSN